MTLDPLAMRDAILRAFPGPGIAADPSGDGAGWVKGQRRLPKSELKPAAVLVPLITRPEGMTILLTQRTEDMAQHPGQVALPGGRVQTEDASPEDTALRETEEEVGLPREYVQLVGRLNVRDTGTGFRVTPVVGLIEPPFPVNPDPREVAAVFEVPLADVMDPRNQTMITRLFRGEERQYHVIRHPDYYIWGLTARLLVNLSDRLRTA